MPKVVGMQRMDIGKLQPEMYKAMLLLDKQIGQHDLPKPMVELVKLRASQINGCVYCVDMHSTDAKAAGETDVRLHGVSVWQAAQQHFDETDLAALVLVITMINAWNRVCVATRMTPANA